MAGQDRWDRSVGRQGHDGLVEFALPLVGLIDSQVHTDAIYESDDEHAVELSLIHS